MKSNVSANLLMARRPDIRNRLRAAGTIGPNSETLLYRDVFHQRIRDDLQQFFLKFCGASVFQRPALSQPLCITSWKQGLALTLHEIWREIQRSVDDKCCGMASFQM